MRGFGLLHRGFTSSILRNRYESHLVKYYRTRTPIGGLVRACENCTHYVGISPTWTSCPHIRHTNVVATASFLLFEKPSRNPLNPTGFWYNNGLSRYYLTQFHPYRAESAYHPTPESDGQSYPAWFGLHCKDTYLPT